MSVKKRKPNPVFNAWIEEIGLKEVAKLLRVEESAVRHWRRGANRPSDAIKMKILKLTKGKITYKDMIE